MLIAQSIGIKTDRMTIMGLMLSNGLIALGGAVLPRIMATLTSTWVLVLLPWHPLLLVKSLLEIYHQWPSGCGDCWLNLYRLVLLAV